MDKPQGTEIPLALASYDLTCRYVWWDEYAECSYFPGGAAELPVLSNPHSRHVVEWGTIPSQRVQYEDLVIVPEKSRDPNVDACLLAHMSVSACRPSE